MIGDEEIKKYLICRLLWPLFLSNFRSYLRRKKTLEGAQASNWTSKKNRSPVVGLLGRKKRKKPFGFRWPEVSAYALGNHFAKDISTSDKLNFKKELEDLERTLNSWKRRKLTLLGKINIVKSLGLSKLTYNALVLYSAVWRFRQKVNRAIFDFTWDKKPHKKARTH